VPDARRPIGLTHRPEIDGWLARRPTTLDFLEVDAEPFHRAFFHTLRWLADKYPLVVRCSTLSIGGPDEFDGPQLARCLAAIAVARPKWIAVPLGFSRAVEIDLGVSVPIPLTDRMVREVADRVAVLQDRSGAPVAIENIASPIRIDGGLTDVEFITRLIDAAGCRVQVDLNSLILDERRHGVDAAAWLRAIDASRIAAIRLTGTLAENLRTEEVHASLLGAVQDAPAALVLSLPEPAASGTIEHGLLACDAIG
jgi:uncharacterized protein (UPF0276 family)